MTTTTHADRVQYECPSWCERPDHWVDDNEDGTPIEEPVSHYGPDFGRYIGVMGISHPLGLTVNEWSEMTAADLRDLASQALAAAEWLEGQA